jgi:hypothetical protein
MKIAVGTILFSAILLLAACSSSAPSEVLRGQLQIITPSGKITGVSCPGATTADQQLCQNSRALAGKSFPSSRMRCRGNYYSLRGFLIINNRQQEVSYSWDCNTIKPFRSLEQGVRGIGRERFGAEAGRSDYQR